MKRIAIVLALAGCSGIPETPPAQVPPERTGGTCGAERYQSLIGQPATVLEKIYILDKVRMVRPGRMYTTDYIEDRLNFHVNEAGTLTEVTCG